MQINPNFDKLKDSYLFIDIAHRVKAYTEAHPDSDVIRMGIGDVTQPLPTVVVTAMMRALEEQAFPATFKGYGPEHGYPFLREAVRQYYTRHNVELEREEIFISDGAKSDIANITELFTSDNVVLVPDPVYPAYVDANIMAGREIKYVNANKENNFLPAPDPSVKADIIYLCSPNNPTGAAYNRTQLAEWVKYAYDMGAVILFDAAYECFIEQEDIPHSIYEIEGAKECAVEICSLSKTASFTGTRCGYTIIPKALRPAGANLNKMWSRRQTTKYNEVPYIVQRGAEAALSPDGQSALAANIIYYKRNAQMIGKALDKVGIWYCGAVNSPYVWLECPKGMSSWDFFDYLLNEAQIVGTPGAGFGTNGEGYFRLTGFGDETRTREATNRIIELFNK